MKTDVIPASRVETRQVKVVYWARAFYAHCPSCGRARKCRYESDGTYTLICGCRRDGANKISYLIDASEVTSQDEYRTKYVDVTDDELHRGEEGLTLETFGLQ